MKPYEKRRTVPRRRITKFIGYEGRPTLAA